MSEPNRRAEQAGILVLGKILATLSDALVILVLVRLLGKADVGVLGALLLVHQTVSLFMTAGFPAALMYALPTQTIEQRKAIAWQFVRILIGLGFLAALVLLGVGSIDHYLPDLFESFKQTDVGSGETPSLRYLILLALFPIAELPTRILPNLLVVEERAKAAAGVGIIRSIGMSAATVIPLALEMDLWAVMGAIDLFGLAYSTVLLFNLHRCYSGVANIKSPMTVSEIFKFALPLGATDTVSNINNRVDQYLIFLTMSAASLAEYQVGAWQIPFVVTIPASVGVVYAAHFRELFKEGKFREGIAIWRESIDKVSLIVIPVTMVFLVAAEEVIVLLFTSDYTASVDVFRLYCVFTLGRVATFGSVIVAAGRPGLILKAALFTLISNIVISVPLVIWLGFIGPALGTVLAFIPAATIYCWYIAKSCDVKLTETFPLVRYLTVVSLASLIGVAAYVVKSNLELAPGWSILLQAAIVLGGFAAVATATRLISREDWAYVSRWVRFKVQG